CRTTAIGNRTTTTRFATMCVTAMAAARVLSAMVSRSPKPGSAATTAVTIAPIPVQYDMSYHSWLSLNAYTMLENNAQTNSPMGTTTSMGCNGCPRMENLLL